MDRQSLTAAEYTHCSQCGGPLFHYTTRPGELAGEGYYCGRCVAGLDTKMDKERPTLQQVADAIDTLRAAGLL